MNPYQAPRAELFWMTAEERVDAQLRLSARRWAVAAALAGTLGVAATEHPDPRFLVLHGLAALVAMTAAAGLGVRGAAAWIAAPWRRWVLHIALLSAGTLACGLLGIAVGAVLLAWTRHPAPLARLEAAGPRGILPALSAASALAFAACGAWGLAWRWKLASAARGVLPRP